MPLTPVAGPSLTRPQPLDDARAQLTRVAQQQDPRGVEVAQKVDRLVQRQFGGDYRRAFNHYANGGREVNRDGVMQLLRDAGVGSELFRDGPGTRGMYADGLIDRFDTDRNSRVSWNEFTNGLAANGVNIPR